MELAASLVTLAAMTTLAVGAMYVIVSPLGRRMDDLGARMSRLEVKTDSILDTLRDLGQRVAHLEARGR